MQLIGGGKLGIDLSSSSFPPTEQLMPPEELWSLALSGWKPTGDR